MKVDLDAIQTRLATRYGEVVTMKADDVLALAAELRAAREVVEAARRYEGGTAEYQRTVWAAIGAYDEAVGS